MCLLVKQPSTTSFTDEFLVDVFTKNSDGLGVMYAEDGKIHVYKCLPATSQDFVDFYRKHIDGKDCVWHARMQTHGDIDFDNCHPYKVTENIWLAHNGILSTGNDADKKRSDTWHFIRNVMAPALEGNPELMLDTEWINFMGELIGRTNKFGLVNSDGDIALINEHAGVEFVGAWLSNTYAWSTHKFGFKPAYEPVKSYQTQYGKHGSTWMYNGYSAYDEYEDDYGFATVGKSYAKEETQVAKGEYIEAIPTANEIKPFVKAAFNQWQRRGYAGIEQWVKDAPHKAAALIAYWYDDVEGITDLINDDPDEAACWIADLFRTDSIQPSMLN